MLLSTSLSMLTMIHLIVVWVVFIFLPSMTLCALHPIDASIGINHYCFVGIPILTLLFIVNIISGLTSIVLPIVRIGTDVTLVIAFIKGAPNSFEMEEVER